MNYRFEQFGGPSGKPVEPLPEEISPQLQAIDERLGRAAAGQGVPAGLADRVFLVSVSMLPRRHVSTTPRLRLAGHEGPHSRRIANGNPTIVLHRMAWAQLALAASVMMACAVAAWLLLPEAGTGTLLAKNGHANGDIAPLLIKELNQVPQESVSELDNQLAHLLDTSDLKSPDDVTGQLSLALAMYGSR
jgi:hypothetical protein